MLTPVILVHLPYLKMLQRRNFRTVSSSFRGLYGKGEDGGRSCLTFSRFVRYPHCFEKLGHGIVIIAPNRSYVILAVSRMNATGSVSKLTDSPTRLDTSNCSCLRDVE